VKRWALAGGALGAVLALVAWAPAQWLAAVVNDASGERVLLADARGTVWNGSAQLVLTGGAGSRDASILPSRLHWTLGLDGTALLLRAQQDCCMGTPLALRLLPGLGKMRLELLPPAVGFAGTGGGALAQWPAAWLMGLGTPWNTLRLSGTLALSSQGFAAETVQGRWILSGQAQLDLRSMSSGLSTLDMLGSYRIQLQGDARGDVAQISLSTTEGALQIVGNGQWAASRLRFNGQASAAPGSEAALSNLLNLIGRRQGALSLITIG
jgi:general secretion pathway protein N